MEAATRPCCRTMIRLPCCKTQMSLARAALAEADPSYSCSGLAIVEGTRSHAVVGGMRSLASLARLWVLVLMKACFGWLLKSHALPLSSSRHC